MSLAGADSRPCRSPRRIVCERRLVRRQVRARSRPRRPPRSTAPGRAAPSSARGTPPRRSAAPRESVGAPIGQDHELLDVDAVVGVRAAVDDVHHRHRHHRLAAAARWRYSGSLRRGRGGVRVGQRHRQQRVGAEAATCSRCRRASIIFASRPAWSCASRPSSASRSIGVDVRDRLAARPCPVALRVAVAQLHRLARCRSRRPRAPRRGPCAPDSRITSASTVGLPRESMISRPRISTIRLITAIPRRVVS